MKVAVLPVTVSDKARFTTLTRAWIERACESVRRYFTDQSGGRAQLEFKVFDWYALSLTHDDWLKLGSNVSEIVNAEIAEGLQISFEGFDRFVYIQDFNTSIYGVTNGDETRIEARDFDPTLLAHEFGHVLNNLTGRTAQGELAYAVSQGMTGTVSGYALTSYSEALAESVAAVECDVPTPAEQALYTMLTT